MIFFDPLDREIFERALEAAHAAVKANFPRDALDSDEALEHVLRRELIDIALTAGISDAETLCDFALRAFEQGRLAPQGHPVMALRAAIDLPYWKQSLWGCQNVSWGQFAQRCGAYMSRAELMDAAIKKLDEVGTLLAAAGEDRLAADAAELADWIGFSAIPLDSEVASVRGLSH